MSERPSWMTTDRPVSERTVAVVPYDPDQYAGAGSVSDTLAPLVAALRLWRRRILVGAVVAGLLVGIGVWLSARTYIAYGTFIPQESGGEMGKGSLGAIAEQFGLSGMASSALSGGENSPAFYGGLLRSSELLHDVVLTQYSAPHYRNGFHGDLVAYLKTKGTTRQEAELKAVRRLRKSIMSVDVDRTTGLVGFTVETEDPDLSTAIARRVLSLINTFNLERRQTQAGAEREFTARRSAEALDDLKKAESELADFLERNRSYLQSPRLATELAGLRRRVEIAQQVYLSLVEQFETAKVEAVRNTPVITIVDNPEGLTERVQKYTPLKAAVGAVFGAMIMCIVAVLVERRRAKRAADAIESADDERATTWSAGVPAPPVQASAPQRPPSAARSGD